MSSCGKTDLYRDISCSLVMVIMVIYGLISCSVWSPGIHIALCFRWPRAVVSSHPKHTHPIYLCTPHFI